MSSGSASKLASVSEPNRSSGPHDRVARSAPVERLEPQEVPERIRDLGRECVELGERVVPERDQDREPEAGPAEELGQLVDDRLRLGIAKRVLELVEQQVDLAVGVRGRGNGVAEAGGRPELRRLLADRVEQGPDRVSRPGAVHDDCTDVAAHAGSARRRQRAASSSRRRSSRRGP